jgi:hypothetical protein
MVEVLLNLATPDIFGIADCMLSLIAKPTLGHDPEPVHPSAILTVYFCKIHYNMIISFSDCPSTVFRDVFPPNLYVFV